MELLYWNPVNRKRSKDTPCTSPDYVKGYDIDVHDMTALVAKFNRQQLLPSEELRLYDHIRTMMNIVFENPKINPRNSQEKEECADFIFPDMWGAFKYIKSGANPFSYIYRSGYTAACRFFKKKIIERNKSTEINEHLAECLREYREDSSDGRVYNVNFD